jgi:phosphatidylethanolamine-binding protein (PEBP) family uncharacterized protein
MQSLVLIVEGLDAPSPQPHVHAIVRAIPPGARGLPEGTALTAPAMRTEAMSAATPISSKAGFRPIR